MTSPVRRSKEMVTVAYFLARYGDPVPGAPARPPRELLTASWGLAYAIFYRALHTGRSLVAFRNSLKNARDVFDAHLPSGRVGWRQPSEARPPVLLPSTYREVISDWSDQTRDALWAFISRYADLTVATIPQATLTDIEALESADADRDTKTEGGRRVYVSGRIERDPSLRAAALRIHGTACSICGFDYGLVYGDWGAGFAEVHHLVALGTGGNTERETSPVTDLAVVCSNCHRMLHRKRERVLTLDELRELVDWDGLLNWAARARRPEI